MYTGTVTSITKEAVKATEEYLNIGIKSMGDQCLI